MCAFSTSSLRLPLRLPVFSLRFLNVCRYVCLVAATTCALWPLLRVGCVLLRVAAYWLSFLYSLLYWGIIVLGDRYTGGLILRE